MTDMPDSAPNASSLSHRRTTSSQRTWTSRDISHIAVFAALFITTAFISIPTGGAGVPIVLQNAVVIMAGVILGRRRGTAAIGIVLILGAAGLPVLAGGRSVLAAFSGITGGYIIGYLASAWLCGVTAELTPRRRPLQTIMFTVISMLGIVIQYTCGALWMILIKGITVATTFTIQAPFIGPDLAKTVVVGTVSSAVNVAFPDLLPTHRWLTTSHSSSS